MIRGTIIFNVLYSSSRHLEAGRMDFVIVLHPAWWQYIISLAVLLEPFDPSPHHLSNHWDMVQRWTGSDCWTHSTRARINRHLCAIFQWSYTYTHHPRRTHMITLSACVNEVDGAGIPMVTPQRWDTRIVVSHNNAQTKREMHQCATLVACTCSSHSFDGAKVANTWRM